MRVTLTPGRYIVAVSGGVDSVVLLDSLVGQKDVALVVAHFDHGIREDSEQDRLFVEGLAKKYELPFVYDKASLGKNASEATARDARYKFLWRVRDASDAKAIILAHHEDDVLETAVLNLLRGTGRKGLSSLQSTSEIYRPFLYVPKRMLIEHAHERGLEWQEDSTNADDSYLRNHVRHNIMSQFDPDARKQLGSIITKMHKTNKELDSLLINQLHMQPSSDELDREWFIMLPHDVAREIMATWLRVHGLTHFDKKLIERLVVQAKVLPTDKRIDVGQTMLIVVKSDKLALTQRDR